MPRAAHRLIDQSVGGIVADEERDDLIRILTCVRPDQRGSRSNEGASGEP